MGKWIPVLVRIEDFEDITRLVAAREATRGDASDDEVQDSISGDSSSEQSWSKGDLARLAEGKTLTTQRWTRAMDVCGQSPGEAMPTSVVAERAGMSINEWRDAPRKIARHLKRHYPDIPQDERGDPIWPLTASWSPDNGGEVWWTISPRTAALWEEIRAQQQAGGSVGPGREAS